MCVRSEKMTEVWLTTCQTGRTFNYSLFYQTRNKLTWNTNKDYEYQTECHKIKELVPFYVGVIQKLCFHVLDSCKDVNFNSVPKCTLIILDSITLSAMHPIFNIDCISFELVYFLINLEKKNAYIFIVTTRLIFSPCNLVNRWKELCRVNR